MADPDLQVRGRGGSPKKIFSALRASFWSKNKGGPGPLPWIRYCIVSLSKVNLILYGA